MEGDFEGDYKGDFRGDFTQNLEGDLLSSSGQVQVVKCEPNGHHGCGSKMFVLIRATDKSRDHYIKKGPICSTTDTINMSSIQGQRNTS